jgi:hypothetical protein
LGLTIPSTLRETFERDGELPAATREAIAEQAAISVIGSAVASRPAQPDLAQQLGVVGADPEADLERARTAFAAGQLDEAEEAADQARAIWLSAPGVGRNRLTSVALLLVAALVATWIWIDRRRRPSRPVVPAVRPRAEP